MNAAPCWAETHIDCKRRANPAESHMPSDVNGIGGHKVPFGLSRIPDAFVLSCLGLF
ncbi:Butyrophilin subfamily 1 member A1 [Platysternon megacephalum]|uniref:Butyrophilin subfamily 1 member A1 n=1 Tax=Platysternon megacephalum TaxID=55544 RepID=A0A4D9DP30_9SAUR|nr:Butyrophilin subfamily 1 member A1 [Platysternon megacephalum]